MIIWNIKSLFIFKNILGINMFSLRMYFGIIYWNVLFTYGFKLTILKFTWIFIFSSLVCWDISAVRQTPKTIAIFCVYLLHNCQLMSFMGIKKTRKMKATLFPFGQQMHLRMCFLREIVWPCTFIFIFISVALLFKTLPASLWEDKTVSCSWKCLIISLGNSKS